MAGRSKRFRQIEQMYSREKVYSLEEAIEILKKCPSVKFDQSVDVALKSGIDIKKSEQQVRGTVGLPHGTGKEIRILVFARGDKVQEALDAGAAHAGHAELLEKVAAGWVDFDAVIATPDMMRDVGKLGKVLGPRGLMPTPKGGTVTADVAKAIKELKAGKVEFKSDKSGVINNMVGKLSFETKQLVENILTFLTAVARSRPASAKGQFLQSLFVASTMGPGLRVDLSGISES